MQTVRMQEGKKTNTRNTTESTLFYRKVLQQKAVATYIFPSEIENAVICKYSGS